MAYTHCCMQCPSLRKTSLLGRYSEDTAVLTTCSSLTHRDEYSRCASCMDGWGQFTNGRNGNKCRQFAKYRNKPHTSSTRRACPITLSIGGQVVMNAKRVVRIGSGRGWRMEGGKRACDRWIDRLTALPGVQQCRPGSSAVLLWTPV